MTSRHIHTQPRALRAQQRRRSLLAALSLLAAASQPALAQVPSAPDAPTEPTTAAPHDSIAQRVVACGACHGKEGRATNSGWYPRIAGKPAGYLYNQLRYFRDGQRVNAAMSHFVDPLSDDYLREIADYFGALDLPYPPPQPATAPAEVLERGRVLATVGDKERNIPACSSCHGDNLLGLAPAVPGLLGLPPDYIGAQLAAWRSGQRKALEPDCMGEITHQLSHEDVYAASVWLAAQPVPAEAHVSAITPEPLPLECGSVPKPAEAATAGSQP